MPTAAEILEGLAHIANTYLALAVVWHLAIAIALALLTTSRVQPTRRVGALLLVLPLVSVGALAWINGNPFNGIAFSLAALVLGGLGARLPKENIHRAPTWALAVGAAALAYAWVYPHFLEGPWWMYLIASPLGLVPCPTLSAVLGFGLLAGGFESRAWSLTAAGFGLFYALFGMLRLGVWLDVGLLVAALALATLALRRTRHEAAP